MAKSREWDNVKRVDGGDGNVWKYVFEKKDAVAEAVLYKYPTFKERTVICCSTQSGCPVGCRFCGAGDKFVRSLTSAEIYEQVTYLFNDHMLDPMSLNKVQVMFMSMGEPLLNQKALLPALRMLNGIVPHAKLLISTSGPNVEYKPIRDISKELENVGLQFSVHESTDAARNKLIPFEKKLSLAQIAYEGEVWAAHTGRQPFFNYCAHEKNTSDEDVARLARIFDPSLWQCTVSVVCERDEHVAAANARQRELASTFMSKMVAKGYSTRMFDPAGQDDIGGGCGQLWFVQDWMRKHPELARDTFGDLPSVHAPKEVKP